MKKDHNYFHILKTIESDSSVSQRMLSSQMELNVASVNFAMKNLIQNGFVTKVGENPRRTKYYITPEGMREKTNLAYMFYCQNIPYYMEVRNNIESRIVEAINGIETDIAIYGTSELSETAYIVVSKLGLNFLGFFLEDSKVTNDKIFGYGVQGLKCLKTNNKCLLLLTEKFIGGEMDTKNISNLNLVD